jgi:hypothetical protein
MYDRSVIFCRQFTQHFKGADIAEIVKLPFKTEDFRYFDWTIFLNISHENKRSLTNYPMGDGERNEAYNQLWISDDGEVGDLY